MIHECQIEDPPQKTGASRCFVQEVFLAQKHPLQNRGRGVALQIKNSAPKLVIELFGGFPQWCAGRDYRRNQTVHRFENAFSLRFRFRVGIIRVEHFPLVNDRQAVVRGRAWETAGLLEIPKHLLVGLSGNRRNDV